MRVYVIGRGYQVTEIDPGDAAWRFLSWLAGTGNPALDRIIQLWLWQPPDAGGLGALAESASDVAQLRAAITEIWRTAAPHRGMRGGPTR